MFLSKRSNGNWYVFYDNSKGNRTCISTKTKLKRDAIKFLSNFEYEVNRRGQSKVIPISVKEYAFQFLKYSESVHSPKTTKAFKTTFKFWIEYFGNNQLSEINHKGLSEYFQYRINNTSIFAARKDYINISSVCSKAVQDGYLLTNPCKKLKRFKIPEKQPIFFSEVDFQVLLGVIDNQLIKDIALCAVNTGLRQMEILSLEWNQINFREHYLILDNRNHTTKSKKIRTIPLNLTVLQVLTLREQNKNGNLVFTMDGDKLKQEYVSKGFKDYVIKAKLNSKLNFHSLRHTFASWLVQKGVSIYEISKLLGHSSISVTEIYSHLRTEDLMKSVNLLNN